MVFIEFYIVLVEVNKMASLTLEMVNLTAIIGGPILLQQIIQMTWSSLAANAITIMWITCFPTIHLRSSRACIQTMTSKKALVSLGTIVQLWTGVLKSNQCLRVLAERKSTGKLMWRSTHSNVLKCKAMAIVSSSRL